MRNKLKTPDEFFDYIFDHDAPFATAKFVYKEVYDQLRAKDEEIERANERGDKWSLLAQQYDDLLKRAANFMFHDRSCILAQWQAGEPTPEGGYRQMFRGEWYEKEPEDKTPLCECGLGLWLADFDKITPKKEGEM